MFKQLKQTPFNEPPESGFKITDKCFLLITLCLITLRFFIKKIGNGFSLPKGPNFSISLKKILFIAVGKISAS